MCRTYDFVKKKYEHLALILFLYHFFPCMCSNFTIDFSRQVQADIQAVESTVFAAFSEKLGTLFPLFFCKLLLRVTNWCVCMFYMPSLHEFYCFITLRLPPWL